jgi:hypothetical protein
MFLLYDSLVFVLHYTVSLQHQLAVIRSACSLDQMRVTSTVGNTRYT